MSDNDGWKVNLSDRVPENSWKKTALTAAIRAKQLMLLDRAAMDRPNAMENTPTAAMLAAGHVRRDK
jgi:hypothetical protein